MSSLRAATDEAGRLTSQPGVEESRVPAFNLCPSFGTQALQSKSAQVKGGRLVSVDEWRKDGDNRVC